MDIYVGVMLGEIYLKHALFCVSSVFSVCLFDWVGYMSSMTRILV